MTKDGRIIIPKLTLALFADSKTNLNNYVADIRLAPA
jgi:hypothetical protein